METLSNFAKLHIARYIDAIEYKFELLQTTLHSLGELHDKFCTNSIEPHGNHQSLVDEEVDDNTEDVNEGIKESVNADDEQHLKEKRRVGRPPSTNGTRTKKRKSR